MLLDCQMDGGVNDNDRYIGESWFIHSIVCGILYHTADVWHRINTNKSLFRMLRFQWNLQNYNTYLFYVYQARTERNVVQQLVEVSYKS